MELTAPAVWLRDNCSCSGCRHPGTGQKLLSINDIGAVVTIDSVSESGDKVRVQFGPDGHESEFDADWLAQWWSTPPGPPPDDRAEDAKRTWIARDLGDGPTAEWPEFRRDPAIRARALTDVQRLGFVVLHGVEPRQDRVLDVVSTFGFVRKTNYGAVFDVRIEPDPVNLAFTALAIGPHTDNPYRDPVPTLQILHCLTNSAPGGESGFVDGFRAAAMLRDEEPDAFAVLTTTAVTFRFAAPGVDLRATRPMIGLDPYGRVREIRFNNRSLLPVRLSATETERFYAAYRAFDRLVNRPELRFATRMRPGDCIVFDNTRLLHARTAFSGGAGARHLQGCYADLDGLASALAVLRKVHG